MNGAGARGIENEGVQSFNEVLIKRLKHCFDLEPFCRERGSTCPLIAEANIEEHNKSNGNDDDHNFTLLIDTT